MQVGREVQRAVVRAAEARRLPRRVRGPVQSRVADEAERAALATVAEQARLGREQRLADAPALQAGSRVVLGGLSSRPELNGQRGVAQSFEGGRYAVALEGGGESVRVRPGNLSPAAPDACLLYTSPSPRDRG